MQNVGCFTVVVCVRIIQVDVVAVTGEGPNIALYNDDDFAFLHTFYTSKSSRESDKFAVTIALGHLFAVEVPKTFI